jgi:hypothetical protein
MFDRMPSGSCVNCGGSTVAMLGVYGPSSRNTCNQVKSETLGGGRSLWACRITKLSNAEDSVASVTNEAVQRLHNML